MCKFHINASNLVTNPHKCEMTKAEASQYAEERVSKAIGGFSFDPTSVDINMWTEGEQRDPVQKISVKVSYKGRPHPITQEAHSRNIQRAIDRVVQPLSDQVRRLKTQKVDATRKAQYNHKVETNRNSKKLDDLDFAI